MNYIQKYQELNSLIERVNQEGFPSFNSIKPTSIQMMENRHLNIIEVILDFGVVDDYTKAGRWAKQFMSKYGVDYTAITVEFMPWGSTGEFMQIMNNTNKTLIHIWFEFTADLYRMLTEGEVKNCLKYRGY